MPYKSQRNTDNPELTNLIPWMLAGLLVRIGLMPFTTHVGVNLVGDIVAFGEASYCFLKNHILSAALYPPLAQLTIATFQSAFTRYPTVAFDSIRSFSPDTFKYLFLLKSWYLIFDFAAAYFLWRMFSADQSKSRLFFIFWALNPLIPYTAYFHGQFDIVPIFFVALGLCMVQKDKLFWGTLWIGLGMCYKNFPLFFLLPAIIILAQSWRKRVSLLFLGILPYVVLMSPFFYQYRASVSSYPDWFFKAGYDLGFGAQVYFFFVFYAALLWYFYYRKAHTFEALWRACFAILLVYYQFSYFDLHYWVWIVPFAAIYWVERPREAKPFYLVIGLCLLVLLAPTPLARFLAPISPRFFLRLPSLMELLNPYLPMLFIVNVVRSLLAGTCFYLAYKLLRDMPASRGHPEIQDAD